MRVPVTDSRPPWMKQEVAGFKLALTVAVIGIGYFVAEWLIETGVLQ
jgi:hypothetical protein